MNSLLKSRIKYGAVYAKIMALYSRLLKSEDYEKMSHCSSVGEIAAILSGIPGYREIFEKRDISRLHRSDIENILKTAYKNDFKRFYGYIDKDDVAFIEFHETVEILSEIMRFLHLYNAGKQADYFCVLPDNFISNINIDFGKLSEVTSYDEFLSCAAGSRYYSVLKQAAPKRGGKINIPETDTRLFSRYYSELIKRSSELRSRSTAGEYIKYIKKVVEMINIVRLIRIKLFYPEYADDLSGVMLNAKNIKSKTAVSDKLISADKDELNSMLKENKIGKELAGLNETNLDNAVLYFVNKVCRKYMHSPYPSVFTVIAYFKLKSIEIKNIINITEGVRYSLPPEKIKEFIII